MAATKVWIITTSGNRAIDDVANDLAAAGLKNSEILREMGCITGSAAETDLPKLRSVEGVADVSPDTPIDIGPPGQSETW